MILAADPPVELEGRWLPAGKGHVLLATPVLRSKHDLTRLAADELPEERDSAELLSLHNRFAKARKQTSRTEESLKLSRHKIENLSSRITELQDQLEAALAEISAKNGNHQAMAIELAEVMDLIESYDRPPEPVRFSLRDCFGDALKSLAEQARRKRLELACHIPPTVPDQLRGDPARLRLIIVALTGKAIQFTKRDAVIVSVREYSRRGDEIVLETTVTHTGLGGNVTDPGAMRRDSGQHTSRCGRPGMAIATRLVKIMNGTIHEESGPGGRKAVRFTARFSLAAEKETGGRRFAQDRLTDLPVLLAYSNITNRQILHEMLFSWGMQPRVVGSGPESIEALTMARDSETPYSLILIDDMMAGMDGFVLAEKIRRVIPRPNLGIILLTTNMTDNGLKRMADAGVDAYLKKPVKESELKETIQWVLEKRATGSGHLVSTLQPSREPVPAGS